MRNDTDERIEIVAHEWLNKKDEIRASLKPLVFDFSSDAESGYPEVAISGATLRDSLWVDLRDLRSVVEALDEWAAQNHPKWKRK